MFQAKRLILIGYKSSGKSFFGKLLASELNFFFIDTDRWLEELYHKNYHNKLSCREISLKLNQTGFRDLERQVIQQLDPLPNTIIATGGGAILLEENCKKFEQLGTIVYLAAEKEMIKNRILSNSLGFPSFLDSNKFDETFEKTYLERREIYERICSVKISLCNKSNRQILDELLMLFFTPKNSGSSGN